ncbi:hypothetical protein DFJ77DRAFT_490373 [Powellomyces hirtus]|nr:hypothetical protein DFJ77DRAFT_490373 [Powellomyces hirtus]
MLATTQSLSGKVALVTGSRGIGKGIAIALAENGANVAVTYSSSKSKAVGDALVEELKKLGAKAAAFEHDVRAFDKAPALIEEVVKTFGGFDILVNNAGVSVPTPVGATKIDDYDYIFDVNVKGVYFLTEAAVKHIRDYGRIISITSILARMVLPNTSIYSASKAAVEAFTRSWAVELASRHITANSVNPGPIDTDMFNGFEQASGGEASAWAKTFPGGRVGQLSDVGDVVAFLASEKSRWITGTVVGANGGALMV